MKPASFRYLAPVTTDEAVGMLGEHGDCAKILAGGQSLVPVLNYRLGRFDYIIDINRIGALSYVRMKGGWLEIGAMTRQSTIEFSELVARQAPLLSKVTKHIAHLPIRTRGTIGGSITHADPSAEDPAAMLALEAEFDVISKDGSRSIKAQDFFLGPLQTALAPQELLVCIRIPIDAVAKTSAFEEVSRRRGDFAIIGVAAQLSWQRERITKARISVCGLEAGAMRLDLVERELENTLLSDDVIKRAARMAAQSVAPQEDFHASSEYRRYLVEHLTERVLTRAQHKSNT